MVEWLRETPWRQGHLLTEAALKSLFPEAVRKGFNVAMVISHDCDLAQLADTEPSVELILGTRIDKVDGNYGHAKNSRRLHLSITDGDVAQCVELVATNKVQVLKNNLASHSPEASARLDQSEQSILQRWLSARYRRAAFPDEFDARLAAVGIPAGLAKILKPLGSVVVAMFFDVDGGKEVHHNSADDPYSLFIYLLYTDQDSAESKRVSDDASRRIKQLFVDKFFDKVGRRWKDIELEGCLPISDQAMTYAQSAVMKRWNGDYISLRAEPQQSVAE